MTDLIELKDVRPHDLVRVVSRPIRFGHDWWQTNITQADLGFELLHRPNPKPAVGTILTGKQVRSRMWKRGTKFCFIKRGTAVPSEMAHLTGLVPLYTIVELTHDGQFMRETTDGIPRLYLTDDSEFVLVYRPEEESDRVGK